MEVQTLPEFTAPKAPVVLPAFLPPEQETAVEEPPALEGETVEEGLA
jgi:hypothetical protein